MVVKNAISVTAVAIGASTMPATSIASNAHSTSFCGFVTVYLAECSGFHE